MNKLDQEIIWAVSTTGEDFQCVHADFAREQDARIAELRKYLRALVAQCERSPDGNVPIAGCTCAVCDLAREAALVASSL